MAQQICSAVYSYAPNGCSLVPYSIEDVRHFFQVVVLKLNFVRTPWFWLNIIVIAHGLWDMIQFIMHIESENYQHYLFLHGSRFVRQLLGFEVHS